MSVDSLALEDYDYFEEAEEIWKKCNLGKKWINSCYLFFLIKINK
jgi:hypothetical protein